MNGVDPDISMIVIVYNDASRLPAAVRSVLDQTKRSLEIIIVDDASTDATPEIAARFAADHPGLIRVVRLPVNSGGGGRPRNVGLDHARGRYVMFLDSDDTLDRHACQTMHSAALSTQADFVSGLCVQVVIGGNGRRREAPWFSWLYRTSAVHGSLAENPDLLYDTLSTNKCYRRSFLDDNGLRFPEGLPHEDLLFATRAYLAAHRIALTPHRIYNWFVYPKAERHSVSARRGDIRQFADRIVIHRMLDEAFLEHGDRELKIHKDVKFVNHDIRLYVAEYAHRDEDYQREFRRLAGDYLRTLDPAALDRCEKAKAIAAYLILRDDHEGLLAISDYLGVRGRLTADLVEHDHRIYWCDRHLDTEEGRRILDVTSFGLHSLPLDRLNLAGVVKDFTTSGAEVTIGGEICDPLGRVSAPGVPRATLEFKSRGRRARFQVPVTLSPAGPRIRWQARFSLTRRMLRISGSDRIWDLRLRLSV
ncbi:MAG: glycosyltransferase, partial [Streptosporangiaceae bacterium]